MENEADLADDEASGEEKTTKEKEKKEEKEKGKGKKQDDSGLELMNSALRQLRRSNFSGKIALVFAKGICIWTNPSSFGKPRLSNWKSCGKSLRHCAKGRQVA